MGRGDAIKAVGREALPTLSQKRRGMRVSKLRVGVTHCERQQPLVECPTAYPVTVSRFNLALRAAQSVQP